MAKSVVAAALLVLNSEHGEVSAMPAPAGVVLADLESATVQLPSHLKARLEQEADERGMSFARVVRERLMAPEREVAVVRTQLEQARKDLEMERGLRRHLEGILETYKAVTQSLIQRAPPTPAVAPPQTVPHPWIRAAEPGEETA